MRKRSLFLVIGLALALLLGACAGLPGQSGVEAPGTDPARERIQAAATQQAVLNRLQNEAHELELTLEEKLGDKYTGMLVDANEGLSVDVYLADGSTEDLKAFVEDPELLKVIEVVPAEVSRKEMREFREGLKAKLADAGIEITTSILMDPPRLEIYTLNKAETTDFLEEQKINLPAYTKLIEQNFLDSGG